MNAWPHQIRGVNETLTAINDGAKRVVTVGPTGSGKSLMMAMLVEKLLAVEKRVILYTNRRLLLDQTARNFLGHEIDYGLRAAGHEFEPWKPFQISSFQTEVSRLSEKEKHRGWTLFDANVVLVDEAHINTGPSVRDILAKHVEAGAAVVGWTATPIDLAQCYDKLIVACNMSEGRNCGALVPAWVYGPDEPDLRSMKIKAKSGEDFSEGQQRKAMMTPTIFGRVWDWWNKLNPDRRPTLGFAPGVNESLGFAMDFHQRGATAAHIDGDGIWVNGEEYPTTTEIRQQIFEDHKCGRIQAIWNRFVLREGIDLKWAEFGILATIYGSLSSYLQSVGRLLRGYEGKQRAIIIDHGGNYHRFGSPNADREWNLEYTSTIINGLREEYLRLHPEKEPFLCPQCRMVLASKVCPCGFEARGNRYPRYVVQVDGSLKELTGPLYRKRSIANGFTYLENWKKMYFRARASRNRMNFNQAIACFQTENNWQHPDPSWPFMPKEAIDLFRRVCDVPRERLH